MAHSLSKGRSAADPERHTGPPGNPLTYPTPKNEQNAGNLPGTQNEGPRRYSGRGSGQLLQGARAASHREIGDGTDRNGQGHDQAALTEWSGTWCWFSGTHGPGAAGMQETPKGTTLQLVRHDRPEGCQQGERNRVGQRTPPPGRENPSGTCASSPGVPLPHAPPTPPAGQHQANLSKHSHRHRCFIELYYVEHYSIF